MPPSVEKPDWTRIDTVLLDLDGTLLDLAFDNHFWRDVIPAAYAASRSMSVDTARERLSRLTRAREGTLAWYCIEHWSRELGLDVGALKREAGARIAWLPGARKFLRSVRAAGKRIVLLTNAHPRTLQIKDERTRVREFLDAAVCSHEVGAPKEDRAFWDAVRSLEPFEPTRSLFVDDSPAVLAAARAAGIRWVYGVTRPDSSGEARDHGSFPAVDSVSQLEPEAP